MLLLLLLLPLLLCLLRLRWILLRPHLLRLPRLLLSPHLRCLPRMCCCLLLVLFMLPSSLFYSRCRLATTDWSGGKATGKTDTAETTKETEKLDKNIR
jgi:hypothetical protein